MNVVIGRLDRLEQGAIGATMKDALQASGTERGQMQSVISILTDYSRIPQSFAGPRLPISQTPCETLKLLARDRVPALLSQ